MIAVRGTAALGALSIALLLTPELARATSDPATPPTAPAAETASTSTAGTPAAPPPQAAPQAQSSAPAAPAGDGEGATEVELEVLLDAIVEAAEGESTEDGAADDPEDDLPPLDPGDEPGSSQQQAAADASATQTGPQNENVTVRVDDPGDTGPVGQSNAANANANASAKGPKPKDDGTESDASAKGKAKAEQNKPKNTNVEVRVDSPGDIGPVTQSNAANATAGASGDGGTASSGEATASAAQEAPQNVNVVVRVDSPGDNGPVDQSNDATATAGAASQTPAGQLGAGGTASTFETDQLVTTSGSATVTNDGTLGQEIDQDQGGATPPEPGAGASAATAGAAATTGGSATATQTGALNATVSIRIDSPGSDGPVKQSSKATKTGPDGKVVTVSTGTDVDIALSLTGAGADAERGSLATWIWNWVWDGAWKPPAALDASLAPTAGALWSWLWENAPAGAATTPAPPAASAASAAAAEHGVWRWTWTWLLPDGSTWSLERTTACECAWVWTWVWDWSKALPEFGEPAGTNAAEAAPASELDPATDAGPVTQLNAVSATAEATVELEQLEQILQTQTGSDPELGLQGAWAGQRLANDQVAIAAAEAAQDGALNLNVTLGFPVESVRQANTVKASTLASARAAVEQTIVQAQQGTDETVQWADAEQWAANGQTSIAVAQAVQSDAANLNLVTGGPAEEARLAPVEQANEADAGASATSTASIVQLIGQAQEAGLALIQSASATQLHANVQTALAASVVTQTRTTNLHDARVPAGSRATNPSLRQRNIVSTRTTTTNTSVIDAWILQTQAGSADIELSTADQQGVVSQTGEAYSPASQLDLLNYAGWRGIEPPFPEEPVANEETVSEEQAQAPLAATTTTFTITSSPPTILARSTTRASSSEQTIRGGSDRLDKLGGPLTAEETGEPGSGGADRTAPHKPPAPPWTSHSPGADDAPPVAVPGHSARPASADDGKSRAKRSKGPFEHDGSCAGIGGTSSCAPYAGGGSSALIGLGSDIKLAAPAHIGPHVPGPVLGRSVGFLEPFERPG